MAIKAALDDGTLDIRCEAQSLSTANAAGP